MADLREIKFRIPQEAWAHLETIRDDGNHPSVCALPKSMILALIEDDKLAQQEGIDG